MQERYNASMASKRLCTVASSSRGTADSAGAEGSGSPSAASAASSATAASLGAAARLHETVPSPYEMPTERSPGDDGFEVPCMTEEEAARVTRGFMAVGGVRNLVKALEKALSGMGAKVCPYVSYSYVCIYIFSSFRRLTAVIGACLLKKSCVDSSCPQSLSWPIASKNTPPPARKITIITETRIN